MYGLFAQPTLRRRQTALRGVRSFASIPGQLNNTLIRVISVGMSCVIDVNRMADQIVISLRGRFNHEIHADFKAVVAELKEAAANALVVDLSGVKEMDSSALGLLLLLRQTLGGKSANIRISGSSGAIRKILQVANFQRFFPID